MGGGGSYGSGESQGRESGSELHFAYDKVERLGAWNSGWQIVIGVGYGICIIISRERGEERNAQCLFSLILELFFMRKPVYLAPNSYLRTCYHYGIDLELSELRLNR